MTTKFLLGELDGIVRLRVAKDGYDALDLGLTNEQLVFDSAWDEILSIYQGNWAETVTASVENIPVSGGSWSRTYVTISFDTLPYRPMCLAWQVTEYPGGTSIGGYTAYRSYRAVQCTSHTDHITATMPGGTCAYVVFANPLEQRDAREDDNSGANGGIIGVHPTRGPGLFISRKGADVGSCPDDDLRLSTNRPAFQIAETGVVWGSVSGGAIGAAITLRRAFPNRPPVIVVAGKSKDTLPSDSSPPIVYWIDDETIYVQITTTTAQPVQYLIPSGDPAYADVADTVPVRRIHMDDANGLLIAQADVAALSATPEQLLFNSNYSALHVSERHTVSNGGTAATGSVAINPQAAAVPFSIFGAYFLSRWWCAPGGAWTGYIPNYSAIGSPPTPNLELFAFVSDVSRINYVWAGSNTTPQFTAAIIDHSAVAFEEITYAGDALEADSTYDDFSSSTAGAAATGWVERTGRLGFSLRVEALSGSISGKAAKGRTNISNDGTTYALASLTAAGSAVGDCDILVGMMLPSSVSAFPTAAAFKCNSGGTNFQMGGVLNDISGGVAVDNRLFVGPDASSPPAEKFYDWSYGDWYWVRVNVSGGRRAVKIWARGDAEPVAWNLIGVGPGLSTGYVGVYLPATSTTPFAWVDFFSVCTTGRPAWGPL